MTLAIIFDSVGVGEWFVLLAVVLIVVGPKNLPSTIRKFGNYYSKFRRAAESFKRQLMDMDNEINNAINSVEKEVEQAVSIPDESYAPSKGEEGYGREYDGNDYPGADYPGQDYYGSDGYPGYDEPGSTDGADGSVAEETQETAVAEVNEAGVSDGDKKTTAES